MVKEKWLKILIQNEKQCICYRFKPRTSKDIQVKNEYFYCVGVR